MKKLWFVAIVFILFSCGEMQRHTKESQTEAEKTANIINFSVLDMEKLEKTDVKFSDYISDKRHNEDFILLDIINNYNFNSDKIEFSSKNNEFKNEKNILRLLTIIHNLN